MKKILFIVAILSVIVGSCQKEEKTILETTQLSLRSGTTSQISVRPNATGITFISDNELIATVSATGVVTAIRIGTANISVKKGNEIIGTCRVTVTASHSMYREPYLVFGSTISAIKSYETRRIDTENSSGILYVGENTRVDFVLYALSNSRHNGVSVLIPATNANSDLLVNFLRERYIPIGVTGGGIVVFVSMDGKMGIGIDVATFRNRVYYMVFYYQVSGTSSISNANQTSIDFDQIVINEIQKIAEQQQILFDMEK